MATTSLSPARSGLASALILRFLPFVTPSFIITDDFMWCPPALYCLVSAAFVLDSTPSSASFFLPRASWNSPMSVSKSSLVSE